MGKQRRLDNELVAEWKSSGLKIYAYFTDEEDDTLRENFPAGSVVLSYDAQLNLSDEICSNLGGCDVLKDALAEIERLRGLLRDVAG